MKTALTAVLILATLAPGPARAASDTWREQSQSSRDAAGVREVSVENARGLIRVTPSADGRIRLTALKVVRSPGREHSLDLARATRVETSLEGGRYHVVVRYPQRRSIRVSFWDALKDGFELPMVEVRLQLEMPPALPVALRSTSGDLESEGLTGIQRLATTSGDIEVNSARGEVDATTTSGDIAVGQAAALRARSVSGDLSVTQVAGGLAARTTSGNIDVKDARGRVELDTVSGDLLLGGTPRGLVANSTSGDVEARGAVSGEALVTTASGNVLLDLARGSTGTKVTTGSGEIRVGLADRLACSLDLHTSSGSLDVSLPIRVGSVTRHRLSGSVLGGGPHVVLRSASGDIAVTQAGGN